MKNVIPYSFAKLNEILDNGIIVLQFADDYYSRSVMLDPILERFSEEFGNEIKICKIQTNLNQEVANSFNITSVPSIVILDNRKEMKRLSYLNLSENVEENLREIIQEVVKG